MSGYSIYVDPDNKPDQRRFVETVKDQAVATRDADYIRKRLPKEDRVWHEWSAQPQDVPIFDLGQLREAVNEPGEAT